MATKTTKNEELQVALNRWFDMLLQIQELRSSGSTGDNVPTLHRKIDEFARTFVPLDVDEEDISHYTNNLLLDEEFFGALVRELGQCATGERVESIEETDSRSVYFLYPPEGAMNEAADFDLFRELAFIKQVNSNNETEWRAEG
mmetsp:Transcript_24452/g.18571  ORF Transcript_24452/g.18571 Transcript_24452/m.18571 type:complete len:144 (-) Transcript_24452:82-513(-)